MLKKPSQPKDSKSIRPEQEFLSDLQFVGVFLSDSSTEVQIVPLYRGDAQAPDVVFRDGFTARGMNMDVLSHVNPVGEELFIDSGCISTSTAKYVASKYSRELEGI